MIIIIFFYIVFFVGQFVNLIKLIKLISNKRPSEKSNNALLNLIENQSRESIQTEFALRLIGLFFFYGAIWGWIDIIKHFRK